MFKRYYATIQEHGNNRNGLGVDDTLRKYYEKYYSYFDRFNDTFQFLNKLETDPAFRQEALSNRDNLFKAMREYPKMDKEVREKFSFDAGYRQELLSDTAPMKATLKITRVGSRATPKATRRNLHSTFTGIYDRWTRHTEVPTDDVPRQPLQREENQP